MNTYEGKMNLYEYMCLAQCWADSKYSKQDIFFFFLTRVSFLRLQLKVRAPWGNTLCAGEFWLMVGREDPSVWSWAGVESGKLMLFSGRHEPGLESGETDCKKIQALDSGFERMFFKNLLRESCLEDLLFF